MKIKTNLILSLFLATTVSFIVIKNSRKADKHELPDLVNLDSIVINKSELKGKVVIVSYFQTWCSDCAKEEPQLEKLQAEIGKDSLAILLISDEPLHKIRAFKSHFNSGLSFYHCNVALKKDFGIGGFPTTYLLDKEGRVKIKKVEGINWYTPEIVKTVRELLRD